LYAVAGLVAGLCGASLVLRFGTARASAEKSLELTAIACVVLGGVRVTGGVGHVVGPLLGVATVATLLTALSQAHCHYRDVILGAVLTGFAVATEAGRRLPDRRALSQP